MSNIRTFTVGSLYIAGFQQSGGGPHAGLILAPNAEEGSIAHIKHQFGAWSYEFRKQRLQQSMSLSTLLKIHDVSAGAITSDELDEAARSLSECLNWTLKVVQVLHSRGLVNLTSVQHLANEFSDFAGGNRNYARRTVFPNVKASANCS
ncbi:hypothetical protein PAXINDRAFT_177387 [Paxillus involutus ATCC 200175]|uniref:Unplaced genomic scaffold PAXINscaffold_64, whole genome shotgun sequence n=1 Tax=Paxillus involutus ATCC 200175 TaxID=664439 RepID=A0A0C9T603_PAXIN|nr:hypothetical protein PAXINDRAFT_177387 [Paxillus involutus ATCC 200175]